MKLFIHDLENEDFQRIVATSQHENKVVSKDGNIHHCIGCFGCWIKTPGVCVINDKYKDMGENLSKCNEVIIISKCYYGGFSPFIKNILDRSISYIHPYFVTRNGKMHHRRRYENHIDMKVWFYGEDISEKEKKTAEKLLKVVSINLDCTVSKVTFVKNVSEMEGEL